MKKEVSFNVGGFYDPKLMVEKLKDYKFYFTVDIDESLEKNYILFTIDHGVFSLQGVYGDRGDATKALIDIYYDKFNDDVSKDEGFYLDSDGERQPTSCGWVWYHGYIQTRINKFAVGILLHQEVGFDSI